MTVNQNNGVIFSAILDLYSKGDMLTVRSKLLHSTAWQQALFTAYGESQQSRLWINWLNKCGLCKVINCRTLSNDTGHSAMLLDLQPSKGQAPLRMMLFIEHNSLNIKQVELTIDTLTLREALQVSSEDLSDWWPSPDPLLISDYDQQIHPQTSHAKPSSILAQDNKHGSVLEQWWEIWQLMQLSHIQTLYRPSAQIYLPGAQQGETPSALFEHVTKLINRLHRHYCQLEQLITDPADPDCIAVKWYMEGDIKSGNSVTRVRLNLMSFLQVDGDKISKEYLLFDDVAFQKQFPKLALTI